MEGASVGPIRVVVVDDHPILRAGVAAFLAGRSELQIVGEADNGAQGVRVVRDLKPDVVLMDLHMPDMNGVEAIDTIKAEHPNARILVLTTDLGDMLAVRALRAGASGYILKSSLRSDLVGAIQAVHQGRRFIHPEVAQQIALHVTSDPLSERELAILRLVAIGQPNKSVAQTLEVSVQTVKAHLKSIFAKLDVTDRTHAVTVAARRGMLEL